jgi:protein TonB
MNTTVAPPPVSFALPPLPRGGERDDLLSPNQRRLMVVAILAAHVAGLCGLMQLGAVREAMREAAPMFVDLIAPPAPPTPPAPPPPQPQPQPQPIVKKLPPPVIAAAPSPAPATFVVPAPPPEPVEASPPAPVAVVAPPAPPAPPPAPRILPASAVQYLETPPPEYPRLSRRNNEAGRVIVRVFIDQGGVPRQVQLGKSSGFERLDDSALAAVLKFRFRPPTENGQPISGWANVPVDFALEK